MITAQEIINKYLSFFEEKGHKKIPSAPLVPENDPTTLFISAGMHPLVPYLLGQTHSLGERLVSVQKCLRTDDIDEVGDKVHHTFFEMLGNWSLGDYFKKEAIGWSFEFLTSKKWLGIDKNKLAISVFQGDNNALFDEESYELWLELGIPKERIAKLSKKNNWWGPPGQTGPCGPDTEMFVWIGKEEAPKNFDANDLNWVEIWNDVFMEYNKTTDGRYELLKQKNVDTGMGLERILAVLNGLDDDYQTEFYLPIIKKLEEISGKKYEDQQKYFRIVADHAKAAFFAISDGVNPSNKDRGYVVRKLIRRSLTYFYLLTGKTDDVFKQIAKTIVEIYGSRYPNLKEKNILTILNDEEQKYGSLLNQGINLIDKNINQDQFFDLYQSHGLYPEIIFELMEHRGFIIDNEKKNQLMEGFKKRLEEHQKLSHTASAGMFKGGLSDNSEIAVKYHTATHLLHAALRQILGKHVEQKGSNITSERLRFDFSHPNKLTNEEMKKVEDLVNEKIQENLKVSKEIMDKETALKSGALGFFAERYGEKVTVYSIGNPSTLLRQTQDRSGLPFSREVCGGPHVDFTGTLKRFKIIKQENIGHGQRRIYAVLEN